MPVNYNIQADVIDLTADTPQPTDVFLVDTIVWYWTTYNRANLSAQRPRPAVHLYATYVNHAIAAQSQLHWCGLSLSELAHSIERTERETFAKATGFDQSKNKEFRHNHPAERNNVVVEIQAAWSQVKQLGSPIELLIDESTSDAALTRFATQPLDGYDLFMLEAMSQAGVVQIITDDGDFATVPGIEVFTANRNVIRLSQAQGRLIVR